MHEDHEVEDEDEDEEEEDRSLPRCIEHVG